MSESNLAISQAGLVAPAVTYVREKWRRNKGARPWGSWANRGARCERRSNINSRREGFQPKLSALFSPVYFSFPSFLPRPTPPLATLLRVFCGFADTTRRAFQLKATDGTIDRSRRKSGHVCDLLYHPPPPSPLSPPWKNERTN